MKRIFLLSLLSSCVYACEPNAEYPWPSLNKSSYNLPALEESSGSDDTIVVHDLGASLFELHDCINDKMQDSSYIRDTFNNLVDSLDLSKDGEIEVSAMVEDEIFLGYSIAQFHATGLISGFFDVKKNKVFVSIFSANAYDSEKAREILKFCFQQ